MTDSQARRRQCHGLGSVSASVNAIAFAGALSGVCRRLWETAPKVKPVAIDAVPPSVTRPDNKGTDKQGADARGAWSTGVGMQHKKRLIHAVGLHHQVLQACRFVGRASVLSIEPSVMDPGAAGVRNPRTLH
eukprot:3545460-Prymnesium_polylepis.1